jgi:hypothetical protein
MPCTSPRKMADSNDIKNTLLLAKLYRSAQMGRILHYVNSSIAQGAGKFQIYLALPAQKKKRTCYPK